MNFTSDLLYCSETYYTLVDSKQNTCLHFLVVKQPCELAVKLPEEFQLMILLLFLMIF